MEDSVDNFSNWDSFLAEWSATADFFSSVAGVVVIVSIVLAYVGYRSSVRSSRLRNTLDKIVSYRSSADEFKSGLQIARNLHLREPSDFWSLDKSVQKQIVNLINEWDELALYVKHGVLDETLLFEFYGSIALGVWRDTRDVVKLFQGIDAGNWIAFDWLAVRWMIRSGSHRSAQKLKVLEDVHSQLDKLV